MPNSVAAFFAKCFDCVDNAGKICEYNFRGWKTAVIHWGAETVTVTITAKSTDGTDKGVKVKITLKK